MAACGTSGQGVDPIFLEGRAVAAAGDSLIAFTRAGHPGILLRNRGTGRSVELGADPVHSPSHVQWMNGEWFVSDIENGKPAVVVLGPAGELRRRLSLERFTQTPHQFAVLPDGRIVVESPDGTLVTANGDSAPVFAMTERGSKTGLLLGASGGVLHAVPDRYITLYNEFGHLRWRLDWPWARTAFVTEITTDPQGRIHVLAGVPSDSSFIVYSLSSQTGEVVTWSKPAREPTFVVDRLGGLKADDAGKWLK
ncbi:MAG: hypothetical protein HY700_01465 [Gemmatimonadetes bacterium]|nr:hypothetical protein [Gemmatimonadota bacterium]